MKENHLNLKLKVKRSRKKKKKMRIQILCNREAIMNGKNVMGVNDLKTKFVYISKKELKPRPASGFKTDK